MRLAHRTAVIEFPPRGRLKALGVNRTKIVSGRVGTRLKVVEPDTLTSVVKRESRYGRPPASRSRTSSKPGSLEQFTHECRLNYRRVIIKHLSLNFFCTISLTYSYPRFGVT